MPTTFTALRAKIKAELDTLSSLAFVYDYHNPNLAGYPSVTFDVSDEDSAFLTNKENIRTITYQVIIYQEVSIAGLDTAKDILDGIADEVITLFEGNFSLDGVVDWCLPTTGPRGQFETPSGTVIYQQLSLSCNYSTLV